MLPSVLSLMSIVIAASFVQSDSPLRTDAYWKRIPMDARSVFIGKLLGAWIVLAPPLLIGEGIALTQQGVELSLGLRYAAPQLARALLALSVAMIVASVTPSFKTFAGAYIAGIAALRIAGSQEWIMYYRLHATELGIGAWSDVAVSVVGIAVFASLYTQYWTPRKASLVAGFTFLLAPLVTFAVVLPYTKHVVDTGPYAPLPSSNTSVSLHGDTLALLMSIKAPRHNETVALRDPKIRVELTDGRRYAVNWAAYQARLEDEIPKGELTKGFQMSMDVAYQTSHVRKTIVGDSLFIRLAMPVNAAWISEAAKNGAAFELSGGILRTRRAYTFRHPLDSLVRLSEGRAVRFAEDYYRDSIWVVRMQGRSIGREGNEVKMAFGGDIGTATSEILKRFGYSGSKLMQDTVFVVSKDGADTVLMRYGNNGRGGGREKFLPIEGTLIDDYESDIAPFVAHTERERPNWIGNYTVVMSTYEFAGYTPLRAKLKMTALTTSTGSRK
jgi:hypothetical protein